MERTHTRWKTLLMGAMALALLSGCVTTPPLGRHGFTAQQVAVLETQGFVDAEDGYLLALPDQLLFDVNKSDVKPVMQESIARMSSALIQVGVDTARVEGHTDSTGSDELNQRLSEDRARAVASIMQANGYAATHLSIRGWGKTRPIADNATEEGRSQNRRVAIIVTAL